jgi:hypothetical protein
MLNRKGLTKSLHTVTSAVNVALMMRESAHYAANEAAAQKAIRKALVILGQPGPFEADDEVIAQAVRVLLKKMGS